MTTLEHIGIAVKDPEAVRNLLEHLLGLRLYKSERVEREQVQTHFIGAGAVKLELLEALGPDSPVTKFISRRGEGVHHLAFEVENVEETIRRGHTIGLSPLASEARLGADRKRIAFFHPRDTHGLLIEVCESLPTDNEDPMDDASITTFGVPRSPAVAIVCVDGSARIGTWMEVAGMLESEFYTVVVGSGPSGAAERVDGLLAREDAIRLIVAPAAQEWVDRFVEDRKGSVLSTLVCDLGVDSVEVGVRSGLGIGRKYTIPAVERHSRASLRLLSGLLGHLLEIQGRSQPG